VAVITEQHIEKALDFMRDNSDALAKAKAERIYLEQYRKSLKALLFAEAPEGTVADRENYAYRNPKYLELLDGLKVAVEQEEALKWKMTAAEAKIDVWRTQQANARTIDASHR
jgi:hypothetical protein